jgi:hypothetical protein
MHYAMRRDLWCKGLIGTTDALEQSVEGGAMIRQGVDAVDPPGAIRPDHLEPAVGPPNATRIQAEQAGLALVHAVHSRLETGGAGIDRENAAGLGSAHT